LTIGSKKNNQSNCGGQAVLPDFQYLFIQPIKIINLMTKPLPQETIQKVREEVLAGKTKYRVAEELGIGKTTVYAHTVDIPGDNRGKPLSKEIIERIREEVLKGKSKYQIAKEMGLSFTVVNCHTKDLPNKIYKTAGIQGKCIDLLHELLEQGYVNSNQGNCVRLRKLKRFLPMIQRAQVEGKSVYYLSDKNKEALRALIKRNTSRIITYLELSRMSQVFGVNLSIVEKNDLLNRKQDRVFPIIRRKDGGFLSSFKGSQAKLDDFVDETGFLLKKTNKSSVKNRSSKTDSLLTNSDSFSFFCIRNY